jgi:phage shock protein E
MKLLRRFRGILLATGFACIILAPLLWNAAQTKADTPSIPLVSVAEAKRIMENTPGLTVLDVRTPEEFMSGHLKGAVLLSVSDVDQQSAKVLPDKQAPVLVYCHSGKRSAAAVAKLKAQGYTRLWDMHGGIIAWIDAKEPVVK